eukprot:CAMPEP_0115055978 /NCGR_PEP_ID=MMETSP0227-20121206/4943_1 /TAXON_ID=89957 /ORGANISM="Polarella glacialis, Strain CCMP 1383" /LENGTH=57 /DNA_ID=CAMNT_0002440611 /DNA_START=222 /DNA_END=395 /DNA_ORIENTATION=-
MPPDARRGGKRRDLVEEVCEDLEGSSVESLQANRVLGRHEARFANIPEHLAAAFRQV